MALRARSRTAPSPQRCTSERRAGDVLPAVFKDLNPLRQLQNAKRIRRLELGRSRREIWMYWHVLPGLALGTPRLYERRGRDLEACLRRIAEPDRPLVERALARHGALVQLVDGLPHGMIHGEFFGKNVLVRRDRATDAIAVIDWETAATGPQYVDLVSISAGRWTRSQRMAMRRAYFDARHSPVPVSVDWRRFNEEVDVVAILQAVSWLGFWVGSDPNDPRYASHVSRWMHELRTTLGEHVSP